MTVVNMQHVAFIIHILNFCFICLSIIYYYAYKELTYFLYIIVLAQDYIFLYNVCVEDADDLFKVRFMNLNDNYS
jgi:hypothetical protein